MTDQQERNTFKAVAKRPLVIQFSLREYAYIIQTDEDGIVTITISMLPNINDLELPTPPLTNRHE